MYHWRSSTDNTNVPLTQQYQCTTDRHSRTDTTSISATDGAVGYWQYQRTTDRLVLTMYHWPGQQYWQYHCATDCQYGTDNDNNSADAKRKSGGDILTLRMLSGKVQSRKFIAEFRLYPGFLISGTKTPLLKSVILAEILGAVTITLIIVVSDGEAILLVLPGNVTSCCRLCHYRGLRLQ